MTVKALTPARHVNLVAPESVDTEEWRAIAGFPRYEVSNLGRIRWRHRIRRSFQSVDGYPLVSFWKDGKSVHRFVHVLVAEAFIGPKPEGRVVRHRNGVRSECHVDNLAYGTYLENSADMAMHGTVVNGERHPASKLTADQVLEIRRRHIPRDPRHGLNALGREFGIATKSVQAIVQRKNWKHLP